MNRLSVLRAAGFAMALLLAACAAPVRPLATPPEASVTPLPPSPPELPALPSPTPHPFAGLTEWDVVVIGDSSLWGVGEPYAALIEQTYAVQVNLHDEWQGGLSAGTILKALRGEFEHSAKREKWPQLIRDAEVLVVFGNPQDSLDSQTAAIGWACVEFSDPGPGNIAPEQFAAYQTDLGAIYEEVAALRAGRPLILRAAGTYNPALNEWRAEGFDDLCVAFWEGLNAAVKQAAEAYGVQFVDTYAAFNGPDHTQDPREQGWIREDGEHPSDAGAQHYAELLLASGNATWVYERP